MLGGQRTSSPRRLRAVAAVSTVAGLSLLALLTVFVPIETAIAIDGAPVSPEVVGVALWVVVTLALSSISLERPGSTTVLFAHGAMIAAAALGGPTAAVWVALVGTTEPRELRGRVPWWGVLATHCQLIVAWAVGAAVMAFLGGPLLATPTPRSLAAVAVGAAVGLGLSGIFASETARVRTGLGRREAIGLPPADTAAVVASDTLVSWLVVLAYAAGAWWTAALMPIVGVAAGRSLAHHRASWLLRRHPLTGLPNATALDDHVQRLQREGAARLAVLYLDLDGFKAVNDAHGHAAGDELLREAGRRLTAACRHGDFLSHLHGDEFVVVAAGVDTEEEAEQIAGRLAAALEPPISIAGAAARVSATVGAELAADAAAIDRAIREADRRMNAAKDAKAVDRGVRRRAS
jgi:diguanylate cyclase (GGDEF)-like protein